jgi:hypothetical protein
MRPLGRTPQCWLTGDMVVDLQDTERRLPDRGTIARQLHGGDRHNSGVVRFGNIRLIPRN